jgi:hypothetical protein
LECAIIRHAPFADCGRTIWELLPTLSWFRSTVVPAAVIRASRNSEPWPTTSPDSYFTSLDGWQAIERLEAHADGTVTDDELIQAEEYFRWAEWSAEAERFDTPDDRRVELEISYGVADWLRNLMEFGTDWWNTLDYYLVNYSGEFYCWATYRLLHPEHRAVVLGVIRDIFGNPFSPVSFDPSWQTSTTVGLARTIYESRDFATMPVLADALEEAGCDSPDVLAHCRGPGPHVRGCWVVDLVLGKS